MTKLPGWLRNAIFTHNINYYSELGLVSHSFSFHALSYFVLLSVDSQFTVTSALDGQLVLIGVGMPA